MKVFVVQAEHFNVPGIITHVHANRESAVSDAVALTSMMMKDASLGCLVEAFASIGTEGKGKATLETWEAFIEKLQEYYGAAHCYVEIIETELRGFQP